ncbi:DUF4381 domain-containing protein [Pseudomonas sp. LS1212]|uniref:DUF4381 domain-containing protein n=1 Tax=Pseudomonas sp. LS1212 TaxID=2972478 RepID=UPI00215CBD9C|nr:DUF4381 domain-containing protein [Pseudomonas sp. LS1212]UVJ46275.1 DUF4381 domain-containing protein [Pseudomonas sp. LS1212]
MSDKAPTIDQLQELALPPAISYTPQTWGWWLLLAVVLLGALWWGVRYYRQWQRDRYRREGLEQLEGLLGLLGDHSQQIVALRQLPELLKRVALSMPDRPAVGNLGGAQWQAFLERTSREPLPPDFSRQLAHLAYAPEHQLLELAPEQGQRLLALSMRWVETHHVAA